MVAIRQETEATDTHIAEQSFSSETFALVASFGFVFSNWTLFYIVLDLARIFSYLVGVQPHPS